MCPVALQNTIDSPNRTGNDRDTSFQKRKRRSRRARRRRSGRAPGRAVRVPRPLKDESPVKVCWNSVRIPLDFETGCFIRGPTSGSVAPSAGPNDGKGRVLRIGPRRREGSSEPRKCPLSLTQESVAGCRRWATRAGSTRAKAASACLWDEARLLDEGLLGGVSHSRLCPVCVLWGGRHRVRVRQSSRAESAFASEGAVAAVLGVTSAPLRVVFLEENSLFLSLERERTSPLKKRENLSLERERTSLSLSLSRSLKREKR